ncbi:hypothetical protein B0H16DRAFT_1666805 [Mycena metata]|uniref:Uncharacterized protein n=1 Tax=Mycena metata TaxID=1033252 RepID=A0AAD7MH37_9AGAR|nr:hypothetical protein B0H16DRAFT_1666805 [Mycena metata]
MFQTANSALILHGYIGSGPDQPALAFPIRLLEIYRQLHRVCPRFSLDALSKTLTHLHHYTDNVYPPCFYKVLNEPPLRFSWLGAMDGNNSLKLVDPMFYAGTTRADNRTSAHDHWLSPEEVDEFKDEVSNSQTTDNEPPTAETEDTDDDVAWLNVNELESMEVEELARCINTCVDRWRNAVAGIFLVVCRHGHVVVMCDMIRSGELMKYPLAMVKQLLDRYGKDIGLGYNIMCTFFKTLLRSSLGSRVVALNLRGVVPAFHGHAHNRACQVRWHPLYVDGVGLEDFEECERTFTKSNNLASVTRLTTSFHRKQAIDEHFYFHDLDKHAASGTELQLIYHKSGNFIYQNYRQANEKEAINRGQLHALEVRLNTTAVDHEAALLSEQQYFKDLCSEPAEVAHTVEYMDLLTKLYAKTAFRRLDHDIIENGYTRTEIARVKTQYRTTYDKYLAIHEEVCQYEDLHGIQTRWTPSSKEYTDALKVMTERRYKQAVSELERLVVGRLFEMTKLGMSGVAYKLREKLNKALKTRAEAIHKAINRYNTTGMALNPPGPRLTWRMPARREAMVLYFGIKRAQEEKVRLDVEIRRLITAMYDDHVDYYCAIGANIIVNPAVARALFRDWASRTAINTSITKRLVQTSCLAGFTRTLFPGERDGWDPTLRDVLQLTTVSIEYEEEDVVGMTSAERREYDVSGLARESDFDDNLVVELMETLATSDEL